MAKPKQPKTATKTPDKQPPIKKATAGRPSKELSEEDLDRLEALAGYGLTMEEIAKFFKISEATAKKYGQDRFSLGRVRAKAAITQSAFQMAKKGDKTMMIFWLKCQAGWSEKTIVENQGNGAQTPQVLKVVFEEAPPSNRKPNAAKESPEV